VASALRPVLRTVKNAQNDKLFVFVNDAEFPLDKGANFARRAWQNPGNISLQLLFLRSGQTAGTAACIELFKPSDSALFIKLAPASDRIVIQIKSLGYPLAAPAIIQKQDGVRPARKPGASEISSFLSAALRKLRRITPHTEIPFAELCKQFPSGSR
jgi:hypothetical protein